MQVHLRDEGPRDDPRPLVLLHGTSASLHTWDGWVAALEGQHRVIRVDLPGFGLTGPRPDGDYRMAVYVRFVVELMDSLGIGQAVLAGNSFGGNVAWKLAVDHPDRVSRLVLVDAAGYAFTPRSIPIGFRLALIPGLRPLMANLLPRSLIESSLRDVYGYPERVTPELIDRFYELTLRAGNRQALPERLRQSPSGEFAAQIKQVHQPTLIIWGGQDRLIPPENAGLFQKEIAGNRLVMFDDLGHVPHEEDPARTVAAVQAFLAE
jgi:pimeloyl-ACP methyl ester carboxylesterase